MLAVAGRIGQKYIEREYRTMQAHKQLVQLSKLISASECSTARRTRITEKRKC